METHSEPSEILSLEQSENILSRTNMKDKHPVSSPGIGL